MSFGKNIKYCRQINAITIAKRQISSVEPQKIQAKNVVLSQWKLISQLKNYLAKFTNDKMFENILNKEFAHFLQKIQPSVYGSDLVKYFDSQILPKTPEKPPTSNISLERILTGTKNCDNEVVDDKSVVAERKWKLRTNSEASTLIKTQEILDSITLFENHEALTTKIEDLNTHLKQNPEAKHIAVKNGAIRLMLKLKSQQPNKLNEIINENLALLGYVNSVPKNGVRILSIDGGGVRGILVIEMLKKLEELTGQSVHEMFDLICGVSTGAIIASFIGIKQNTLDEISEVYKNLSTQIFTQSTLKGTSNLVWSHSYYDTALWEKLLKEQIGDQTMISTSRKENCPKLCSLSAVVNQSRLSAYVFRNYSLPCRVQSQYMGSHSHLVWEAVRASAAAPTYFEEFKLGNMLHQDGGILFNNPTAVAIHEAKLLWPNTPIQCVLSFGTGRTVPNPVDHLTESTNINNSSWKKKFYAIIDSATDTEGVHTMLSDLLPANVYYRFNPYLTEMLDIAEINPKKLEQLERDAVMYLRRNEDKFQEAAKALSVEKGLTQTVVDWFKHKSYVYNLV